MKLFMFTNETDLGSYTIQIMQKHNMIFSSKSRSKTNERKKRSNKLYESITKIGTISEYWPRNKANLKTLPKMRWKPRENLSKFTVEVSRVRGRCFDKRLGKYEREWTKEIIWSRAEGPDLPARVRIVKPRSGPDPPCREDLRGPDPEAQVRTLSVIMQRGPTGSGSYSTVPDPLCVSCIEDLRGRDPEARVRTLSVYHAERVYGVRIVKHRSGPSLRIMQRGPTGSGSWSSGPDPLCVSCREDLWGLDPP